MAKQVNIIPTAGEHAVLVGQNGSGKTVLACWLLLRIPEAPGIIYDTKIEPKFTKLPASRVVTSMEAALELKDNPEVDYIIVRPPVEMMREPMALDEMLWQHYLHFSHCFAYIDEAYTFHSNGNAGPGLIALLTRGRSRGISTIVSTQRPVRISRFCFTEAKKAYVLRLVDKADRKRIDDIIPNYSDMPQPVKHGFYFFDAGMEAPILFKPVSIDKSFVTGYVDSGGETEAGLANTSEALADKSPAKHVWV